jgi:hypothetical protein
VRNYEVLWLRPLSSRSFFASCSTTPVHLSHFVIDHHNQKLPKAMFAPIEPEMALMSIELSLPWSPSLWLLCMITTAMTAASSRPGTMSNSWKASISTTPVGSRQMKTWKPGRSAGSSYAAYISADASEGKQGSDTHVDSLVACDPVIFLASVVEDTNPTNYARRKRADALADVNGQENDSIAGRTFYSCPT